MITILGPALNASSLFNLSQQGRRIGEYRGRISTKEGFSHGIDIPMSFYP
jgi:hypothetical protein